MYYVISTVPVSTQTTTHYSQTKQVPLCFIAMCTLLLADAGIIITLLTYKSLVKSLKIKSISQAPKYLSTVESCPIKICILL